MLQKKLILNFNIFKLNNRIYLYILSLTISALFFTFYYGYKGVLPIDSFLIYDAGYKILNGFHPFKDYWSITGPILDYIQFFFFKYFGVNWFSYVLHAATINLLFSIIFFHFFLKLGLNKFFSFIYSLSASILAYPSIGTPFMDHHAVIFSLISVMFLILSFKSDKKIYWILVPIFLSISFLSKQIPSSYLLFLFCIAIVVNIYFKSFKQLKCLFYLFIGGSVPVLIFFMVLLINKIPLENFLIQYFYYPLGIGEDRGSKITFDLNNILLQFKFIYLALFPVIFIFFNIIKKFKVNSEIKKDLLIISFFFISILIFIYSQILTKNQILIFLLIPFCLGVSHYYFEKYQDKKIVKIFLLLLLIFTTFKYHLRFNENKKFMELNNADLNLAVDASSLDKSLNGLLWITSEYSKNPLNEINKLSEIKKIVNSELTNKIIISDYQVLPSILKIKHIAPNKWFDILSVPNKNNQYFDNYKTFFIKKLIEQKIETIFIIGKKEVFLKNILKENCYKKEFINDISFKLKIKNCLVHTSLN